MIKTVERRSHVSHTALRLSQGERERLGGSPAARGPAPGQEGDTGPPGPEAVASQGAPAGIWRCLCPDTTQKVFVLRQAGTGPGQGLCLGELLEKQLVSLASQFGTS